jgi:RimJ/RimL family protein N-acetyltransferase
MIELYLLSKKGRKMYYGERIRFRFAEHDDIYTFVRWFNDAEFRSNLQWIFPMSVASEEKWFANMIERPLREQTLCIETKVDEEWKLIGNCSLMAFDDLARSAEIGIAIGEKDFWNKGFGTETMKLLIWHGFTNLNLHRIMLRVYETNPRAIRCYEKAGMKQEGRLREAHYRAGEYIDVLLYSILRSEWDAKQTED